jgi:phage terminase large subunit-like protein
VCDDRARPKHLRENDDKEGRVIEAGRRRDKEARTKYLAGASVAANVSIPADRPVESNWLERFIALLKSVF